MVVVKLNARTGDTDAIDVVGGDALGLEDLVAVGSEKGEEATGGDGEQRGAGQRRRKGGESCRRARTGAERRRFRTDSWGPAPWRTMG